MPNHRRALRASLVVTFAAGSSLIAGCGGTEAASGDDTDAAGPAADGARNGAGDAGDTAPRHDSAESADTGDAADPRPDASADTSPTCPTAEPTPSSACSFPAGARCDFADTCATRPSTASGTDHLECVSGRWTLVAADYVLPCPPSPPAAGTSCRCGAHPTPKTCTYPTGCSFGVGDTIATCDDFTGRWSIGHATCNPPRPDAGADAMDAPDAVATD